MSACLFVQKVDHLSDQELHSLKLSLIKQLAENYDSTNRFEVDKWAGQEQTLCHIYVELYTRENERYK